MVALADLSHLHVLIIAGGSGTRFWPRSREERPKQMLTFWDDHSLLEHTVRRFADHGLESRTWIVTTEALVAQSRQALGDELARNVRFLGEPIGRNTAPCILWGVREIQKSDPEAVICVVPADHYIGKEDLFRSSVALAAQTAREHQGIVTLGIKPNRPETGYGYIERGQSVAGNDVFLVSRFVEKPAYKDALKYISSGQFFWNAGMFIVDAKVALAAFEKCMPALFRAFESASSVQEAYQKISPEDAVSIDYGIMEVAQENGVPVFVLPVDIQWNDLGSFTALEEIDRATQGNVVSHNAASNIVVSDHGLVALLGVNDLVVVKDGDVVLVANKDRCQDIKKLVERVKRDYPQYS